MKCKTITLGLMQDEPELYARLCRDRQALSTLDSYAAELKASHEAWTERLSEAKPGSEPRQIASEALELASEEIRDRLRSASREIGTEALSLDDAMTYVRKPLQSE